MENRIVIPTTAAFILACSAMAASAQQIPDNPLIEHPTQHQMQQSPLKQEVPGLTGHGGMIRQRVMGQGGMMGHGMMGQGEMMRHGAMTDVMMRMIFSLMDSDADATISLQEFQAAHERIFKAMDSNKDGRLTLEEMQHFMHGSRPISQQ